MWIGVLWAGLQVAMRITHVGGKFRHGLLEKSLKFQILSPKMFHADFLLAGDTNISAIAIWDAKGMHSATEFREKLKGKIISDFHIFSHFSQFVRLFPPGLSPQNKRF